MGLVKGFLKLFSTRRGGGDSVPLGTIIVYYKGCILSIDWMHKVWAKILGKLLKCLTYQIWSEKLPGLPLTGILRVAVGNAQTKSHLSYLIVPPPRFDIIISGQYTSPNYTLLNLTMAHLVDLLHKNDITKFYIVSIGTRNTQNWYCQIIHYQIWHKETPLFRGAFLSRGVPSG